MRKEKIILQLGVEIDTLKAHIQRLKRENYKPHQLDVELLQQKTRQFYELLFELEKEVKPQGIPSPPPARKEKELVQPKEEIAPKPEIRKAPPPVAEKPEEKIEEKAVEKTVKEEARAEVPLEVTEPKEPTEEKQPVPEPVKEEPPETTAKPPETKSHFDLFSESSTVTISDTFSGKEEQSLADKMQESRITDLRQSIGINEKFLFINELFNGDMGRYNKAIDELNEMKILKGAETFLLELKVQNQWNNEMPAYLKLKDLIERKYK
jgi:hypothetical protein